MRTFLFFIFVLCGTGVRCQIIEAETGTLSGTLISTQIAGYSGAGYVTGFDADGDKVTVTFNARKGVHDLYVRYASPSGDKFNFIHLNGENLGSVSFPRSTSFTETKVGKVYLQEGVNTLAIVKEWGYFDVDNISVEPSSPSEIYNVSANLTIPSPSAKADSVYDLLSYLYGKVVLSGQYGGATEFNRIKDISGKTPVIRGFDMMDYSPSRVERGASSTETDKAIEWSRERGMVTFCWHWNAPKDLIDQPGNEWWRGFYTTATTFDVTKAMSDPNSEEYALIIRDIDAIAVQLKRLSEANVPILWRPLHEAEGEWFWWGAKGAEPCKWLWRTLFDRLVNHHALNNLIWVWTSTGTAEAPSWYPGDEYVDIIGADIYLPAGTYSSNFIPFDNIARLYQGGKIITLSENGPIPDPEKLFTQAAAWGWFCTWSGNFITDGISNSEAHINAVFNHEYVITMDEIDNIDAIIASLEKKKESQGEETITNTETMASFEIFFRNPIEQSRLLVKTEGRASVVIYDLQGQIQFPEINTSGSHYLEFDFRSKPSGLYILKVKNRRSVQVYRVMKGD